MITTQKMISGFGKLHTNTPTAKNPKPLVPIDIHGIRGLVDSPPSTNKEDAQWLIPSSLESRLLADQEHKGQFWALWADLDMDPRPIAEVHEALICRIVGAVDFELYNSRSATVNCPKSHILVPLATPLRASDWMLAQEELNDRLHAEGFTPDRASEGPAQLCFLPNRGEHYETKSERDGVYFDPLAAWSAKIATKRLELAERSRQSNADREAAKLRRDTRDSDSGLSLIDAFNDSFTFEDVLLQKNYSQRGDKFRHPNSVSGSYSASVKNGRIHSLSTSDPLYTGGDGAHDKFSAFAVLHHRGNQDAALKDAGENWLKIDGEPWNVVKQREYAQAQVSAETRIDRTDSGNVAILFKQTNGDLRYIPETKQWLWWDGERWNPDPARIWAQRAALEVGEYYLRQSNDFRKQSQADDLDPSDRRRLEKVADGFKSWAELCRNKRGLDAMLSVAQSDPRFVLSRAALDQDPHLFGVAKGVVDLRTGRLRADGRDEYVTKRSPVAFVTTAQAPRWMQFVDEITGEPKADDPISGIPRPALASYVKKMLGYCMTGNTHEHKLFMMIGPGSNGKNILLDTVREIMGDYAIVIAAESLMANGRDVDGERPTPGARRLAGSRLAIASESKEGQRLDTNLVKRLTGEKEITARGLHENTFSFRVSHKLVLMTNSVPSLDHVDDATRGRMHLTPFDRKWNRPGHTERDPHLPDGDKDLGRKLLDEAQGILLWLVEGAVEYCREGLEPPAEVAFMTRSYLADQDHFAGWYADYERCPIEYGTLAGDLFHSFQTRCRDAGQLTSAGNPTSFGIRLKKLLGESKKQASGKVYPIRFAPNSDLF